MSRLLAFLSLALLLLFTGCGKSEQEIRALARDEMAKAAAPSYVTSTQVIGPYSPAVKVGNFLFVSGQIGMDMNTLTFPGTDIESQTRKALDNLSAVLKQAGYDSSMVIQSTVYLRDMKEFQRMNLIYGGYFQEGKYPARTTMEVSNLPRDARIEIAVIACKP